jgi:elongation factor Ts
LAIVYYDSKGGDVSDDVKKVALQIAAMDPQYLTIEAIPTEDIEKMKKEFEEEVKASGKPEAVMPNIVAGKLNKKYSEIVLHEQGYMGDESMKIKSIVEGKADLIGFDRI